jgi:hypothetical protein
MQAYNSWFCRVKFWDRKYNLPFPAPIWEFYFPLQCGRLRGCLFGLLVAFQLKKLPKLTKRVCCAVGFAETTEWNRHTSKSTYGGASCGFPQLCHWKLNRYNHLPLLVCLFTETAIETSQLGSYSRTCAAPTGPPPTLQSRTSTSSNQTVVACYCY